MNRKNISREGAKTRRDVEGVAAIVVDCSLKLHKDLGPGLLESVYEAILTNMLKQRGLIVERPASSSLRVHQQEVDHG